MLKSKKVKRFLALLFFCFFIITFVFQAKKNTPEGLSPNILFASLSDSFLERENLIISKQSSYEPLPLFLVEKSSVVGIASPGIMSSQVLGASTGYGPTEGGVENEIKEYVVKERDTLSAIASQFNIKTDTIRWANEISGDGIQPGQELIILPTDGILHIIKRDETLGGIAQRHKGSIKEIVEFNNLANADDVFVGDIIIIPGGEKPTTPPRGSNLAVAQSFVCPTSTCRITQGLHYFNAIDFGEPCGSPIYAAASGTVQRVAYGWNGGAGNFLTILHNNGVVTMYGHIQSSLVSPGQYVSQGQQIALVGGQPGTLGAGISTGCHVHFDVRGGANPFAR